MTEAIGPLNTGLTTGGAGTSTNNATSAFELNGLLLGFYVRYNGSPPAGTSDVTIQLTGGVLPARTVLTITNAATDGFFAVRETAVSTANVAKTDLTLITCCRDKLKVTLTQADDGDSVDVWAVME